MNITSRAALCAILLAGCATEPRRAPIEPPAPLPEVMVEPAPEPVELDTRQVEEAIERPPELEAAFGEETLVDVHFPSGSADLDEAARAELDALAEGLLPVTVFYVDLQGHTDATGDDEANLELAERRARVVREYLHRVHGLPLDRMGVLSLGSAMPAVAGDGPEAFEENRRVVVVTLQAQ